MRGLLLPSVFVQILKQVQDDVLFYALYVNQTVMLADFGKCAVCPKGTQHVLRRNLIRVNFLHSKKERVEKFRAANNPRSGFQHLTGAAFSTKREVCKILNTSVLDFLLARCCRRLRYAAVCFALAPRAGFTSFTRRPSENPLQDDRSFLQKIRLLTFKHSPPYPSPSRGGTITGL